MVSAQIALEKLRQRDQLFKTENEMLKVEKFVFIIFLLLFLLGGGGWSLYKVVLLLLFLYFFIRFLALLPFICVDGECKS